MKMAPVIPLIPLTSATAVIVSVHVPSVLFFFCLYVWIQSHVPYSPIQKHPRCHPPLKCNKNKLAVLFVWGYRLFGGMQRFKTVCFKTLREAFFPVQYIPLFTHANQGCNYLS